MLPGAFEVRFIYLRGGGFFLTSFYGRMKAKTRTGAEVMGKEPKYKPEELEAAVEDYFAGITRMVTVTEMVDSGKKDNFGHAILEPRDVINSKGEKVRELEYILPPTMGGLYKHLGISPSTWAAYAERKRYAEIVKRARGRVYEYLQGETLKRPDKLLGGIMFNIENNFPEFAPRKQMDWREQEMRLIKAELEQEKLRKDLESRNQENSGITVELMGEVERYGV